MLLQTLNTPFISSPHRDSAAIIIVPEQGGGAIGTPQVDEVLEYNQLLPKSLTELVTEPFGNIKSSLLSLL